MPLGTVFDCLLYGFFTILFKKTEHQRSDNRACNKGYDIEKRMVAYDKNEDSGGRSTADNGDH